MNTIFRTTLLSSLIAASLGVASFAIANEHYGNESNKNASDRTAGQVVDDATITASIKTKLLADERTEGFDINVDTAKARVTLRGGADTAADKAAAGDIARQTDGVISVDNQIIVARAGTERREAANQATASGEMRATASNAGDEMSNAGDNVSNASDNVSNTSDNMSGAGEEMSDTWITAKVKTSLLADDDVSGMAIEVETTNKTVHLIGNVSSTAALAEAVRIAQGTDGVTRVDATRLVVRTDLTTNR